MNYKKVLLIRSEMKSDFCIYIFTVLPLELLTLNLFILISFQCFYVEELNHSSRGNDVLSDQVYVKLSTLSTQHEEWFAFQKSTFTNSSTFNDLLVCLCSLPLS